jgi:L-serine deaminase
VNSNSNQAQQRAEKLFKKQERAQDARQAMIKYEAHALAVREETARLRALRLAKGRLS